MWRVRTCKSILHEKNQINGWLGQKFVGGGGGLPQSSTKYILGWWILSMLIEMLVTQVYSFVKTHRTWCMHYIKCKFQWSWLKNNVEENSRKKIIKEIFTYTEMYRYFQKYIKPETKLKKLSLTTYFVTIHSLCEAP